MIQSRACCSSYVKAADQDANTRGHRQRFPLSRLTTRSPLSRYTIHSPTTTDSHTSPPNPIHSLPPRLAPRSKHVKDVKDVVACLATATMPIRDAPRARRGSSEWRAEQAERGLVGGTCRFWPLRACWRAALSRRVVVRRVWDEKQAGGNDTTRPGHYISAVLLIVC